MTKILEEYSEVVIYEEKILAQRAKIQWLSEGDINNKYFHQILKVRKNSSRIVSVCDAKRKWYNEDEVVEQFIKNFQTFLGGNGEDPIIEDAENLFTIKLSENEASAMTRDVTDLEIKEAIFDIDNDKAPGPNGFTALFFKKSWDIVGKDACLAIKEFFKSKKLLYEVNATLVTLIPKTNQPKKVSDFRPIACCNVKTSPQRCAMKIDISKANDTVNQKFLDIIILLYGFHDKIRKWIMTCVTTVVFTLNINGDIFGYFKSDKGLMQGDSISPYLFTLVMEVLTLMIGRKVGQNDHKSINVIKEVLNEFSLAYGLKPNINKNTIFFGSVKPIDKKKNYGVNNVW
ncbi:RNA-directed DNA polymerase, eukaryota, reverse transcriptase zinc-binding domain protein [Tanacetum coccineum]